MYFKKKLIRTNDSEQNFIEDFNSPILGVLAASFLCATWRNGLFFGRPNAKSRKNHGTNKSTSSKFWHATTLVALTIWQEVSWSRIRISISLDNPLYKLNNNNNLENLVTPQLTKNLFRTRPGGSCTCGNKVSSKSSTEMGPKKRTEYSPSTIFH